MRVELTGRQVKITPALHRLVDDRLVKLDRLLHDSAVSLQVVLFQEKYRHRVEVTLHARGENFFHATGSGRDWELALNQALGKINQQARKLKDKWDGRKRQRVSAAKSGVLSAPPAATPPARGRRAQRSDGEEQASVRIIRARRYAVKPMSVDEAALEVTSGADTFLVFRNATTDTINVLFRRADGHLGLIEPEA